MKIDDLDPLDPLLWAKKPRSQCALTLLRAGAVEGNKALAEILDGHVRRGVCNDQGKLLMHWRDGAWVYAA